MKQNRICKVSSCMWRISTDNWQMSESGRLALVLLETTTIRSPESPCRISCSSFSSTSIFPAQPCCLQNLSSRNIAGTSKVPQAPRFPEAGARGSLTTCKHSLVSTVMSTRRRHMLPRGKGVISITGVRSQAQLVWAAVERPQTGLHVGGGLRILGIHEVWVCAELAHGHEAGQHSAVAGAVRGLQQRSHRAGLCQLAVQQHLLACTKRASHPIQRL